VSFIRILRPFVVSMLHKVVYLWPQTGRQFEAISAFIMLTLKGDSFVVTLHPIPVLFSTCCCCKSFCSAHNECRMLPDCLQEVGDRNGKSWHQARILIRKKSFTTSKLRHRAKTIASATSFVSPTSLLPFLCEGPRQ
jgi:hypothetical protein